MLRYYNCKIERLPHHELDLLELEKTVPKASIVDLRNLFPPVFDQGELGSCTANALCGLVGFNLKNFTGSRLFLYYNERKLENDIPDDNGALLSDGIKCLLNYGICSESEWPYDISKFASQPPKQCYTDALKNKALKVKHIINDMTMMKNALINKNPFVVGIKVFESFESEKVAKTGMVPLPSQNEQCLGGHAVVVVGFDDSKQVWILRNSWGINWGDKGYFYLPYLYLLDSSLSSDLWCVLSMS